MKVALVHDFLLQMGGAEKVVEALHDLYPDAPLYTSAYDAEAMPAYYRTWDIRTSFLQRLPLKRRIHRAALLLYPLAFETFDLSAYDVVISSSSAFAKGVLTHPGTLHVCYCHAPMRYAWDSRTYLRNESAGRLTRALLMPGLHYLRMWDFASARRVDHYVANSRVVAARIRKYYGRKSDIIYPPVDTTRFAVSEEIGAYYVVASRFVPYKRLDLAIEAFSRLNLPLKVIGDGRQSKALRSLAGPTIEFLGRVDDVELAETLSHARGFIMPGEEDFGIAPVEANACGRPVIAYKKGGALDSQVEGVTAVFFNEQTVDALCEAVMQAERSRFDPQAIVRHARRFDTATFRRAIADLVSRQMAVRAEREPEDAPAAASAA